MSDATERPEPDPGVRADADAWAEACAEDLAAEKERRRRDGDEQLGTPAEELRRLADAVADRIGALRTTVSFPPGLLLPPETRALLEATARACPVTQSLGPGVEVPMEFRWPA